MAAPSPGLLCLSPEIRGMIYDLVIEPVDSNIYTNRTAYTPESCPLLYVHPLIAQEVQHRLYQKHTIVVPLEEPEEYVRQKRAFAPLLNKVTRRMKRQTDTAVVEILQRSPP